jgi:hypothetical protein
LVPDQVRAAFSFAKGANVLGIVDREMLSPFLDRGGGGSPASPPTAQRERDYIPVVLELFDRTWIRAKLSLPTIREGPRVRPYDLFERPTERTMRFVDAEITSERGVIRTKSLIVLKEAVMFMYEQSEAEG